MLEISTEQSTSLNARKRIRQNSSTVVVIDGLRSQSQPRITLTDISKVPDQILLIRCRGPDHPLLLSTV